MSGPLASCVHLIKVPETITSESGRKPDASDIRTNTELQAESHWRKCMANILDWFSSYECVTLTDLRRDPQPCCCAAECIFKKGMMVQNELSGQPSCVSLQVLIRTISGCSLNIIRAMPVSRTCVGTFKINVGRLFCQGLTWKYEQVIRHLTKLFDF